MTLQSIQDQSWDGMQVTLLHDVESVGLDCPPASLQAFRNVLNLLKVWGVWGRREKSSYPQEAWRNVGAERFRGRKCKAYLRFLCSPLGSD